MLSFSIFDRPSGRFFDMAPLCSVNIENAKPLICKATEKVSSEKIQVCFFQFFFFTLYSDTDRDASNRIGKLYNSINMQAMLDEKSRKEITEKIHREIPVLEKALRKLMDDNWYIMKQEIMLQTGRKL